MADTMLEEIERKWKRKVLRAAKTGGFEKNIKGKGLKYAAGVCSFALGREVTPEEVMELCPGVARKAMAWEEEAKLASKKWAKSVERAAKQDKWLKGYKEYVLGKDSVDEEEEEEEELEIPKRRLLRKRLRRSE